MVRANSSAIRFGAGDVDNPNGVPTAADARLIAQDWVTANLVNRTVEFGLPEVDDRYQAWQIALLSPLSGQVVGGLRISCRDGLIQLATQPDIIEARLSGKSDKFIQTCRDTPRLIPNGHEIRCGDSRQILDEYHSESLDFVITSPPYYNAKPEYSEYATYEEYLELLKGVFEQCHRVLREGRFMVVNASPVLVRRAKRSQSSQRIPVPFHINAIMEGLDFDFVDDIIWLKPEGAGWNTGRGRRFAADRQPLQYKPVPVTEYFLVYRKHTDKLIDWNIRNHPDQQAVDESLIADGYEVTNVWRNHPASKAGHPAVFPETMIRKFIKYYSFRGDIVLDPFAGSGTVGHAAVAESRGFLLSDNNPEYCQLMASELNQEQ